jgi:hypothetical protein
VPPPRNPYLADSNLAVVHSNSAQTDSTTDRAMPNGYVESFNSRLTDECLTINTFWPLAQARVVIGDWKHGYNHHHRRHSSFGYLPRASPVVERLAGVVPRSHLGRIILAR